ncbi:hypothetical protein [Oceanobacillus sp. Castelsardo]|uniref:hypothetical protein n=1 Tax=Oceanobacillus sp. Castelsardo TaxID=1851204 RepID=UPI00083808DC|nr:hypothetical protein [Oceanobacillus sp. Castelsardo]
MRYWKVIVLAAIVILGIGTYYIQNAFANSDYPEFHLEKVGGDEDVVNGLTFMGNYFDNYKEIGENVKITSEDTIYQSELSYFDYLTEVFQDSTIRRLQSDYRKFMRGKNEGSSAFFEDDKRLIYAGSLGIESDIGFRIEMLDKEVNETTDFQVEIPKNNINYMNVVDVQADEKEVIITTRNFYTHNPNESETEEGFHVYRINIENGSLIGDEIIYENKVDHSDKGWTELIEVNNDMEIGKEDYFVFRLDHMKEKEYGFEADGSDYFAYHFETNELKEMNLPNERLFVEKTAYVHGGVVYFLNKTKSGFEFIRYQMDDGELNTIEVPTTLNLNEGNTNVIFHDGKIFIPNSSEEGNNLFVLDEKTGKLVYEGKLSADRELENVYLDLNDLAFE